MSRSTRTLTTVLILVLVPLAALMCWSATPASPVAGADDIELRHLVEYRTNTSTPAATDAEPLDHWQNTGVSVTIWR